MSTLQPIDWNNLLNAYRQPYNPQKAYQKYLQEALTYSDLLKEFSDLLHQQTNVDTASYAIVPMLVEDYYQGKDKSGNLLGLINCIFLNAGKAENPEPKNQIKIYFDQAADRLYTILIEKFLNQQYEQSFNEINQAMSFLAYKNRQETLADHLSTLSESDLD